MTDTNNPKTALIAVDVQPDFMPGGALAVTHGDEVVAELLTAIRERKPYLVVATRDWHPADHSSFTEQGGIWPAHCIAGTAGAQVHPDIDKAADVIVSKATRRDADAYSGFEGTPLADTLRAAGIEKVLVGGLATDYCVKATALDALKAGFEVEVLADAARAVNVNPGDEQAALEEMAAAGAQIVRKATV